MFSHPRPTVIQLSVILAIGFSACSSPLVAPSTPTPVIPTSTPVPPTATPPPLAAMVNGEYITVAEFEAELARFQSAQKGLGKTVSQEEAGKTVLEDLIAQVLLAQGAHKEGFELSDEDLQARLEALASQAGGTDALAKWETDHGYDEASFRVALKRAAEAARMRDKIVAAVPPSAEQVHLQQILTYNQEDANQVLQELKDGADFAKLAELYDPTSHGELGWVPRGYLLDAKVEEAAFSLEAGGVSDVIETVAGFHIIKVLERGEHPLSPDALLSLQEQALKDWVRQQREQSEITIAP